MNGNKYSFLKASTILFILNITASVLNYVCQLVMARLFSVEYYGTINTIFSFAMIIAVPGTTLTMIAAKYYATTYVEEDRANYLNQQMKVVILLTAGVFFAMIIFKEFISNVLSISDGTIIYFALVFAALGYFHPFYSGVFSGTKHFIFVGVYSLIIPIYKLFAIGTTYLFGKNDSIKIYVFFSALIFGVIITIFIGQKKSLDIVGRNTLHNKSKIKLFTSNDINTLILNLSLMFYMNIDLLSVRYYGDETESGLYSAVLLFGRLIFYFATTLGTILLPSVANTSIKIKEKKTLLNRSLYLIISFALLCIIPLNIFKNYFIEMIFGESYIPATKYIIYVSAISLLLSLFSILINYVVGIGKSIVATKIMILIDAMIIIAIFLLREVQLILYAVATIGFIGIILIYIAIVRDYKNEVILDAKQL